MAGFGDFLSGAVEGMAGAGVALSLEDYKAERQKQIKEMELAMERELRKEQWDRQDYQRMEDRAFLLSDKKEEREYGEKTAKTEQEYELEKIGKRNEGLLSSRDGKKFGTAESNKLNDMFLGDLQLIAGVPDDDPVMIREALTKNGMGVAWEIYQDFQDLLLDVEDKDEAVEIYREYKQLMEETLAEGPPPDVTEVDRTVSPDDMRIISKRKK